MARRLFQAPIGSLLDNLVKLLTGLIPLDHCPL